MRRAQIHPGGWVRANAGVCALALAAAFAYSLLAVARHATYRSTGFDLGLFDQVVWHLSHFDSPASSLKGLHSIFGDHFSPVLIAFAPLYWVWSSPDMLLIAQAVLVAASVIPVYLYALPRLGRRPSLALGGAYLLFGGVQAAVWFDFHEVAVAPLLIAGAVLLGDRGRRRGALAAVLALLLVKEDMAFMAVAFGIYFALLGWRGLGALAAGAGLAWYAYVTGHVIPHYADGVPYTYWSYTQLGPDAHTAVTNVIKAPWKLAQVGLRPTMKVRTVAYLFGAFLGVSLLSPVVVLALPLVAERMLSTNANYWTLHGHYSLTIAPVLALAAADGLPRAIALVPRLRAHPQRWIARATTAMLVLSVLLAAAFPLRLVVSPSHYRAARGAAQGDRALALIPAGASVSATNHYVAHLAHRNDVRLLGPGAPATDWVIANIDDAASSAVFPNKDITALRHLLVAQTRGYVTVFSRDGTVVMRRR